MVNGQERPQSGRIMLKKGSLTTDAANELRRHMRQVPDRLPCREQQLDEITNAVRSALEDHRSRTLYISGVPGTGKTATVMQAIRHLRTLFSFHFVEVNGMKVADPKEVFVSILHGLPLPSANAKKRISADEARRNLNEYFTKMGHNDRQPTIILVNEIDMLCTPRQEILYDILNWATLDKAQLIVLAISNTVDLPERCLHQRVSSRLGMNRFVFGAYTFQQIEHILCICLHGHQAIVDDDAVLLVSRKVASVTGDLRKALNYVELALDKALSLNAAHLTIDHVLAVVKDEAEKSDPARSVRWCQPQQQLLMRAIVDTYGSTGQEDVAFGSVMTQYRILSELDGTATLSVSEAYRHCMRLSERGLLIARPSHLGTLTRKFRLAVSSDNVRLASRTN